MGLDQIKPNGPSVMVSQSIHINPLKILAKLTKKLNCF